jgi:hypothetical protein
MKLLRQEHDVGILDVVRISLDRLEWRRGVERQINGYIKCRKFARPHMRKHGPIH